MPSSPYLFLLHMSTVLLRLSGMIQANRVREVVVHIKYRIAVSGDASGIDGHWHDTLVLFGVYVVSGLGEVAAMRKWVVEMRRTSTSTSTMGRASSA